MIFRGSIPILEITVSVHYISLQLGQEHNRWWFLELTTPLRLLRGTDTFYIAMRELWGRTATTQDTWGILTSINSSLFKSKECWHLFVLQLLGLVPWLGKHNKLPCMGQWTRLWRQRKFKCRRYWLTWDWSVCCWRPFCSTIRPIHRF